MSIFRTMILAGVSIWAAGAAGADAVRKPATSAQNPAMSVDAEAAMLRDKAIDGNVAYGWLTQLTTRFGARPAGSESERKAAAQIHGVR